MTRYLAASTAIVLAAIFAMLAVGRFSHGGRARYTDRAAPASSPRPEALSTATADAFVGDAPWALSALPDCFRQIGEVTGPPAYVRARRAAFLPPAATPVKPVTTIRAADCVLTVRAERAFVTRGDTRMTIPPVARFWRSGSRLILDRVADGRETIRAYVPAGPASRRFVTNGE